MKITLYLDNADETGRKVWAALELAGLCDNADVYTTMKDFSASFDQPMNPSTIVIISVIDQNHLQQLTMIRESLFGFRLLLVLPDSDSELMRRGHTFRPRVLLRASEISSGLIPILQKMKEITEPGSPEA